MQRFQQPFFYPASFGIHQLGGRQYSIFTHLFFGEQIRDGIRHKQNAAYSVYIDTTFETHRIKLEQRIEIHKLYTGQTIDLFPGNMSEILFGNALGIRVAICTGQRNERTVGPNTDKIDAPCVDSDRIDCNLSGSRHVQTFFDRIEQRINIPVTTSVNLFNHIGKSVENFHLQPSVFHFCQNDTTARSSQIYGYTCSVFHVKTRYFIIYEAKIESEK